jgi:inosine/xanthosine triphosphatase
MKVAVGSKNPAKVKAVHDIIVSLDWDVEGIDVPSHVSAQPFSDEETRKGALNRANACVDAGYAIGIGLEGGVDETEEGLFLCNWGVMVTKNGDTYYASGAKILLPDVICDGVRSGEELGDVMAAFTKKHDVRKKEGAVGIFTAGRVSRSDMFTHIVNLLVGQYEYNR